MTAVPACLPNSVSDLRKIFEPTISPTCTEKKSATGSRLLQVRSASNSLDTLADSKVPISLLIARFEPVSPPCADKKGSTAGSHPLPVSGADGGSATVDGSNKTQSEQKSNQVGLKIAHLTQAENEALSTSDSLHDYKDEIDVDLQRKQAKNMSGWKLTDANTDFSDNEYTQVLPGRMNQNKKGLAEVRRRVGSGPADPAPPIPVKKTDVLAKAFLLRTKFEETPTANHVDDSGYSSIPSAHRQNIGLDFKEPIYTDIEDQRDCTSIRSGDTSIYDNVAIESDYASIRSDNTSIYDGVATALDDTATKWKYHAGKKAPVEPDYASIKGLKTQGWWARLTNWMTSWFKPGPH